MKSERYVFGVIIGLLIGFCSFSCVSAEMKAGDAQKNEGFSEILPEESEDEVSDEDFEDESGGEDDEDNEHFVYNFPLAIRAINSGGAKNAGEMIEITKLSSDPVSLNGVSIRYINDAGTVNDSVWEFPENAIMTGNSLVLKRENSGEEIEKADLTYTKVNLSQSGGEVSLWIEDKRIDSVCWGKYPDCKNKGFDSKKPTTLVRDFDTFEFSHVTDYELKFEKDRVVIEFVELENPNDDPDIDDPNGQISDDENKEYEEEIFCEGLRFSEVYLYYSDKKSEQFIEFFNENEEEINLSSCILKYKKEIPLSGKIKPFEYFIFKPDESIFPRNSKNPIYLSLTDKNNSSIDFITYPNGLKKGTSYAYIGDFDDGSENWNQTYAVTPGKENVFQEYKSCGEGKMINEETGRCINIPDIPLGEEDEITEYVAPVCRGLQFSEILTYYETDKSEQFIELFNPTSEIISVKDCQIKYKNKLYALEGKVSPESYFLYLPNFSLTKNPTNSNKLELIDANGEIIDVLEYFNGQKKSVSFAQFGVDDDGKEIWLQTYSPTPGEENEYQRFKTCPTGKVINEETGNCVKITTLSTALGVCPPGSYRNPITNRCKKLESESKSALKDCKEGYERNPDTNRCRKIVSNDGEDFPVKEEVFEEKSSFVAIWAIIGVGIVGVVYIIFEYRKEIGKLFRHKK